MNGPNGRLASRVVDSGHFAYNVDRIAVLVLGLGLSDSEEA